jgi:thioredoxin reductase/Pyruvate/2-oxoacid:ferredoxin oxidoreductase delta subunit
MMASIDNLPTLIYSITAFVIWGVYAVFRRRRAQRYIGIRDDALAQGLTEPASLHPVIDFYRCIGCASCAFACPEGSVIGVINGKAELINPTHCIGHGACKAACPTEAISLVFGTAKRGVDIPMVKPTFETNIPGIFIAGELGGMGLIRNAVEQGSRAMESIRKMNGMGKGPCIDVVIVGAGPAGIAASLAAQHYGLRFITVEQDSLGGTIAHFPRGKVVMTKPAKLAIVGTVKFTETTKEKLIEFWQGVVQKTGLKINFQERVEDIDRRENGGFTVKTTRGAYESRAVLLCIGRRGTPRTLGVDGEHLSKVVYRLSDPEEYRDQHVLVVGGGDSAVEAATSVAEVPGTRVTLSYRGDSFSRAKERNRRRLEAARAEGRLSVLLNANPQKIADDHVLIEQEDQIHTLRNDAVIICAGGILPTPFLQQIGIEVETKYGTA